MAGLDFSGITLPFTAADLLTAGVALLGVVGSFLLLALAFKVVPYLFGLIRGAFGSARGAR